MKSERISPFWVNGYQPFSAPNGKLIYFDRAEIESWMKQNRVATESEIEQKAVNYISTGTMQKGGIR